MPELKDPNFFQTVTLICQHDENGALGVVINRPIESLALHDVLSQLELGVKMHRPAIFEPVYAGGPVHNELGLVLHEGLGTWQSTIPVGEHMGLTSSRDVLESMADGTGPKNALLSLGSRAFFGPVPSACLLYTSPSPRDVEEARMPSSA